MRVTFPILVLMLAAFATGHVNAQDSDESYVPEEIVVVEDLLTSRQSFTRHSTDGTTSRVAGETHTGSVRIGPWPSDVIFKITGFRFDTNYPRIVITQARQSFENNFDRRWPDQFSIQVIETGFDFVRIRVRRIDDGTGSSGWGQDLRVNLWIVE